MVSCAGMLKVLPAQVLAYRGWSNEATLFGFLRNQAPLYPVYRYLALALRSRRRVAATLHAGLLLLAESIPLYDAFLGRGIRRDLAR